MTRWFLILTICAVSFSAFADFSDETCKVKSMYDGEKFDSKYKGTFGTIITREKEFRLVFHSISPVEKFYYDQGTAGEMSSETFQSFMEEWCGKLFSDKKCSQIKKVEMIEGEKNEGIGFFHFLDQDNKLVAKAAGMAGLVGVCR